MAKTSGRLCNEAISSHFETLETPITAFSNNTRQVVSHLGLTSYSLRYPYSIQRMYIPHEASITSYLARKFCRYLVATGKDL